MGNWCAPAAFSAGGWGVKVGMRLIAKAEEDVEHSDTWTICLESCNHSIALSKLLDSTET